MNLFIRGILKTKRRALRHIQAEGDPRDGTRPVATPEVSGSATRAAPVVVDSSCAFHELRGSMEHGNENLFVPVQLALVELVRVGRSLEVCTLELKECPTVL